MSQEKRYYIAKPTKTRKTYVLVCYIPIDRKKRTYIEIPDSLRDQVNAINKRFLNGVIQPHEVIALLNDLINGLYRLSSVMCRLLRKTNPLVLSAI